MSPCASGVKVAHSVCSAFSIHSPFSPCCTSVTPLCAFCSKRAVNAPRKFKFIAWNVEMEGLYRESLHYTYMMHCTRSIPSRIPSNVQQTRGGEHCCTLQSYTHPRAHTLFMEIQYPGDAWRSLVCLCGAQ